MAAAKSSKATSKEKVVTQDTSNDTTKTAEQSSASEQPQGTENQTQASSAQPDVSVDNSSNPSGDPVQESGEAPQNDDASKDASSDSSSEEKTSTEDKKAEPLKARADASSSPDASSDLARILKDVPAADQAIVELLKQYIDEMSPGRNIDPARGASLQVSLYRILRNVINNEVIHFEPIFRAVLKLFELNRNGVFHPSHAFRFVSEPNFNLSKNETHSFFGLVNMLTVTSSSKGRELAVKTIDFEKTLRYGLTNEGRTRLLSFFGV